MKNYTTPVVDLLLLDGQNEIVRTSDNDVTKDEPDSWYEGV